MDTSDLLERGARSLVVDLCKQLEDVVTAVPNLKRFAYSLARESVGMKPAGRSPGSKNGDGKKRLLDQLDKARKLRKDGRKIGKRPALTAAQKDAIGKRFAARWAEAHRLGYKGTSVPSNAVLAKLRAKAKRKSTPKPTTARPETGAAAE